MGKFNDLIGGITILIQYVESTAYPIKFYNNTIVIDTQLPISEDDIHTLTVMGWYFSEYFDGWVWNA